MTQVEVFEKELSNLYALSKQINHHFQDYNQVFLQENLKKTLNNYLAWNSQCENNFAERLRALEINPGNTIDSVAKEIIDNLNELQTGDHSEDVRNLSFKLCFNRLVSYQKANMENMQELLTL